MGRLHWISTPTLYLDTLRGFAAEQGIAFIDLTVGDIGAFRDDAMFADFHHLTPEAAEELTRQLAAVFVGGDVADFAVEDG